MNYYFAIHTPAADSGVTGHEYRYKAGSGNFPADADWTAIPDSGVGGANEAAFTVTGLNNGTPYTFEVRAVNATGGGPAASDEATPSAGTGTPGTPSDTTVALTSDPNADGRTGDDDTYAIGDTGRSRRFSRRASRCLPGMRDSPEGSPVPRTPAACKLAGGRLVPDSRTGF